jgi:uncharacterized protein YgfB (UPF0149 family)
MLTYNQKNNVLFKNADILTARHQGCFCGLGVMQKPKTGKEVEQIKKLASLKTYSEIREINKRTPYKEFINQF